MLTEKTFDTDTVTINYAEGPPGGMPLTMLHGITIPTSSREESPDSFRQVIARI